MALSQDREWLLVGVENRLTPPVTLLYHGEHLREVISEGTIIRRSGWGWDDEKNMSVPPSEDAWEEMFTVSLGLMDLNTATTGQFLQIFMDEEDYWEEVDDTLILLHTTLVSSPTPEVWSLDGRASQLICECRGGNLRVEVSRYPKRALGVLKARFTILVKRRNYPIKTQAKIAMAYCVLHNFIRMEGGLDYIFRRGQCDELVEGDEDVQQDDHVPRNEAARGDIFRNELATRLWIQHTARGYEQIILWHEGHACMITVVLECPYGKGHCGKRTSKTSKSYGRSFYACPQSTS
ncbi:hypothetical protein Taro_046049 [Colocasia esculenta]|uniref:DDE Tnp4 domain-containing protein n=1 Tax=Colocasia esculenta TaxID=4460 RepID=A0A843WY28_COLES|nr:hypothetical protein [Colocasia esculenta]